LQIVVEVVNNVRDVDVAAAALAWWVEVER